jgi:ABC-type lipoprotein release transport system permease subunit
VVSKIAWKNIWRSPFRSLVVILSIVLGIWAATFLVAFSFGLNDQRTREAIESTISHIQIHNTEFSKDQDVRFWIDNPDQYRDILDTSKTVRGYSERIILGGMISSPTTANAARIMGVDPEREASVTNISTKIEDGAWFEGISKNPVVIGAKLAEKLKVKVRSKVVLTFQDEEGDLITGAFRVAGIFKTSSSKYDELNLFIRNSDVDAMMQIDDKFHEIAILLNDNDYLDTVETQLEIDEANIVETWKEISPELGYADEIMAQMLFLFIGIIMLALAFGIVNNMLMAVLERKRELGMLQAVGMNKGKVFKMIVLETLYIGLAGGPLGILVGYITVTYFGAKGIDLSIFGEGLRELGISTFVYTHMPGHFYVIISSMVVVMTLLSSIYPARKALGLNPVEAIRST